MESNIKMYHFTSKWEALDVCMEDTFITDILLSKKYIISTLIS